MEVAVVTERAAAADQAQAQYQETFRQLNELQAQYIRELTSLQEAAELGRQQSQAEITGLRSTLHEQQESHQQQLQQENQARLSEQQRAHQLQGKTSS